MFELYMPLVVLNYYVMSLSNMISPLLSFRNSVGKVTVNAKSPPPVAVTIIVCFTLEVPFIQMALPLLSKQVMRVVSLTSSPFLIA